tara:strand:+ start:252 stop:647 length:396 start_codon:yes stop_codon:yes gene_type:complete
MSKKVQNSIGFTQDILTRFTISDRIHNSQIKFHLEGLIRNINYNTNKKDDYIETLHGENREIVRKHTEDNREVLDRDKILSNDRDIAWQQDQINVNDDFKALIEQTLDQLYPADQAIKDADDQALIARYSA